MSEQNLQQFVITGASCGIGLAAGNYAHELGFQVYGCARNPQRCVNGFPYTVSRVDVAQADQAAGWIDSVPEKRDTFLILNHGVLGPKAPLADVSPEEFHRVMTVNASGQFNVLHAALNSPISIKAICMLTSSVGRMGRATWGPYSASKFATESMVQTLADEVAAQQTVVFAFNPGGTATKMRAEAYPEEDPNTLPTAADVAKILVDLTRSRDSSLHGQSVNFRDLAEAASHTPQ